ncbi:translation initiation factor IF-2-like isoform X2 [Passer montanus]|uniref:translation initiation factor IF-2-like isoform X2 n=1 Tax=Passer montanus TaxID=9160 RepID=UPI0019621F4F|nr:translation initiation factor IF-2-like isoform X2 [Passer montanus]
MPTALFSALHFCFPFSCTIPALPCTCPPQSDFVSIPGSAITDPDTANSSFPDPGNSSQSPPAQLQPPHQPPAPPVPAQADAEVASVLTSAPRISSRGVPIPAQQRSSDRAPARPTPLDSAAELTPGAPQRTLFMPQAGPPSQSQPEAAPAPPIPARPFPPRSAPRAPPHSHPGPLKPCSRRRHCRGRVRPLPAVCPFFWEKSRPGPEREAPARPFRPQQRLPRLRQRGHGSAGSQSGKWRRVQVPAKRPPQSPDRSAPGGEGRRWLRLAKADSAAAERTGERRRHASGLRARS